MTNDNCACGTTTDGRSDSRGTFLARQDEPLEAPLPDDVGRALGRLFETESVPTLGAWVREVRRRTGGGAIAVEDLCHATDETPHWGEIDGTRHHFVCFYDAVVLAALRDRSVDIRTESPDGEPIEMRAAGEDELNVSPEEAVFSFGIEKDVEPPTDREPRREDVYAAVCPYVKAFPDVQSYERWAETVPAATVAMSLLGATEFASALVR
jgi:alkylmercury lyase